MKDNRTEEKIFDLMNSKPFAALTPEEKQLVLSQMSEADYTAMYNLNNNIAATNNAPASFDDSKVKSALLAAFDKKFEKKKRSVSIFNMVVPFYQAAAAVVVAVMLMAGWHYYSTPVTEQQGISVVYKIDTIFLPAKDTGEVAVNIPPQVEDSPAHNLPAQDNAPAIQSPATLSRSIKKDSGLKQFMVSL